MYLFCKIKSNLFAKIFFQISFLLPVESIPGRMGFLMTLMLCNVSIFNSTAEKFPPNANAITQWILSCLLFIILAILEYTLLLGYNKYQKPSKVTAETKNGTKDTEVKFKKMSKALDKWMLVIVPPTFIIFTTLFWVR